MRLALVALALLPLAVACGGGAANVAVEVVNTPARSAGPATPTSTPVAPPEVLLSETTVPQAGAVLVSVVGQVTEGAITFLGRTFPLTQGSQSLYAFAPVDADDPTGEQELKITYTSPNGSKGQVSRTLTVVPTTWTVDAIEIGGSLAWLLDPRVQGDELALLAGVYSGYTPQKLWSGAWQPPVQGVLTTRFGELRSYNGSPANTRHLGADYGVAAGTPVTAANGGRVVLARKLAVRGNIVIIDHGGGVFSAYAHMASLAVAEGQTVQAGDVVGAVGSSGLSTGAHLHWEMAVGGVMVDATRFASGENGF